MPQTIILKSVSVLIIIIPRRDAAYGDMLIICSVTNN